MNESQREEICFVNVGEKVSLETRIFHGLPLRREIAVVFVHPYGAFGANMYHEVINQCFLLFAKQDILTVRYNSRGTGKSTGRSTMNGTAEVEDLNALCDYVKKRVDLSPKSFLFVGLGIGASIITSVTNNRSDVVGQILISHPLPLLWPTTPSSPTSIPTLFLHPSPPDSTGPSKTMRDLASRTSTSVRIECVAGIDKNWKNDETAIIQHLNLWLRRVHVLPSFEKPPSKSSLNTLTSTRSLEAKSLDKKELLGTERRWDASKSTHHLAERTEKDLSKSTPNLSVESKGLKGTRAKTNSMATLEDDGLVGSSRSTLLPSDLKSSVMRIFRPTSRQ